MYPSRIKTYVFVHALFFLIPTFDNCGALARNHCTLSRMSQLSFSYVDSITIDTHQRHLFVNHLVYVLCSKFWCKNIFLATVVWLVSLSINLTVA